MGRSEWLETVGVALVSAGAALIYLPMAFITVGVFLFSLGRWGDM